MVFFPILFALVLDHFGPVRMRKAARKMAQALADRIEAGLNVGHPRYGRMGWLLLVSVMVVPVWACYRLCLSVNVFLAFLFNVLTLYFCLGLKENSRYFSSILLALIAGDEAGAGRKLCKWRGKKAEVQALPEIARLSIERALLASHRQVFGVFFWFMFPYAGPAGAVFYRLAAYLARAWKDDDTGSRYAVFGQFALRAFFWVDWIPARLTAMSFAVAGNFEDAVYAWRNFAGRWPDENTGTLLAAGGGALGVRLGTPLEKAAGLPCTGAAFMAQDAPEWDSQPAEAPSVHFFQYTAGLIRRVLLLWLLLFLFFTIVTWLL